MTNTFGDLELRESSASRPALPSLKNGWPVGMRQNCFQSFTLCTPSKHHPKADV